MKTFKVWDIQVWDGGSMHNHKYYVTTKEAADQWKKHNTYDYVSDREFIIHESYDELMEYVSGDTKRKALAKLTNADKIALGLK